MSLQVPVLDRVSCLQYQDTDTDWPGWRLGRSSYSQRWMVVQVNRMRTARSKLNVTFGTHRGRE